MRLTKAIALIQKLAAKATEFFARFEQIAMRMSANQAARRGMPREAYSAADTERINRFQTYFRASAGSFGYESAPIRDIEISKDALVPCLAQMELREIRTDIKSDSSASDFVRLIWSYLLALHQTLSTPSSQGNHPGLLTLSMNSDARTGQVPLLAKLFEREAFGAYQLGKLGFK